MGIWNQYPEAMVNVAARQEAAEKIMAIRSREDLQDRVRLGEFIERERSFRGYTINPHTLADLIIDFQRKQQKAKLRRKVLSLLRIGK